MNPETKKLKERTQEYKRTHPQYARSEYPEPVKRKKRYTKRKLTGREVCHYCGKKLTRANATFDHVVPLSLGGDDSYRNIVWCCKKCNMSKGNKLLSEWMEEGE